MRRGHHLRTPANPCLPNAPPVADAEQSASSQPSPSRRKSCPAPAAAEPATTSPQLPRQCTIKPCGPITANSTPRENGSTSGGTRASAAVKPRSPAYARPNATEPARGSGPAASFLALASNATASGLGRHLYAPSVLRRRHSGRLSHRSWLALPVLVMVRRCAWGRGQDAAVWRSTGGKHGQRRLRFSAVLLYGIIRHGDCPRGREPAHLMQPFCLATLLGQGVQVRENVAGD